MFDLLHDLLPVSFVKLSTKKNNLGGDVVVHVHIDRASECGSGSARNAELRSKAGSQRCVSAEDESCNPRPTVLLLGWYGSSARNLDKYAGLYRQMGYNSVATTSPTTVAFSFSHASTLPFLLSILRILAADARLLAGGLVFASFSNGGAILFPKVAQLLGDSGGTDANLQRELGLQPADVPVVDAVRKATAAIVFDSSPCYLHADKGAEAVVSGLGLENTYLSFLARAGFHVVAKLQVLLYGDVPARFWRQLREAKYPCPEMYIYSTFDKLLDHTALEDLVAFRKQNGLTKRIDVFRVDDAHHVQIMRVHPKQYAAYLNDMNEWGVNAFRKQNNMDSWILPKSW